MTRYKGFGHEHTVAQWAHMANMRAGELRYWVETKGLTVEDILQLKKLSYKSPYEKADSERKQRTGPRLAATINLVHDVLLASGYMTNATVDDITVKPIDTNGNHAVQFQGQPLGVYNYRTGALKLTGGGGINLKEFDPLTVLIEKNSLGTWSLQRETQELMLQKFERTEKKSRMHEPKPKNL